MKFQKFRRAGIPVETRISEFQKFWKKLLFSMLIFNQE